MTLLLGSQGICYSGPNILLVSLCLVAVYLVAWILSTPWRVIAWICRIRGRKAWPFMLLGSVIYVYPIVLLYLLCSRQEIVKIEHSEDWIKELKLSNDRVTYGILTAYIAIGVGFGLSGFAGIVIGIGAVGLVASGAVKEEKLRNTVDAPNSMFMPRVGSCSACTTTDTKKL